MSVAVTVIEKELKSELVGVPEKVCVAVLKLSQFGSGELSDFVATKLNVSPTSTSLNVLLGTANEKAWPVGVV
jgi:hypothetical protein